MLRRPALFLKRTYNVRYAFVILPLRAYVKSTALYKNAPLLYYDFLLVSLTDEHVRRYTDKLSVVH